MWPSSWCAVVNQRESGSTLIRLRTSSRRSTCQAEAWLFFFRPLAGSAGYRSDRVVERLGELREPERDVELLGLLDDELARLRLERRVEVDPFDQARPVLAPAVRQPVGGDRAFGGLDAVAGRQGVLGPGVQLLVEGPDLGEEAVGQRDHLGDRQAVVGHLEREERVEAQLPGDPVAQVAEPEQALAERAADRLGDLPDVAALGQVARLDEDAVQVVGRGMRLGLAGTLEGVGEAVLRGRLARPRPGCGP